MTSTVRKVYFYCRANPEAYQDDVVVLADGLRQLGVEVYGNCNYWLTTTDPDSWLVRHDPTVEHQDCDVVAVSYVWSQWIDSDFRIHNSDLPSGLFSPGRPYRTAYVDLDDGYRTRSFEPQFREFDVVFRAKYNQRCLHPANHRPWALGLSQRVLACTSESPPWAERAREVLINFNASHPYVHPARAAIEGPFTRSASTAFKINRERDDLSVAPEDPWDSLMWRQTQRRHSSSYYKRICRSQALAAFCGDLIPPGPASPPYLCGGRKAKLYRHLYNALALVDPRAERLIQWDSWRFWEGLAAGCLVFNFDLPHYGVRLPAMPENFVHYVGIRPNTLNDTFDRLLSEPELAQRIASRGREWAIEHYSPVAMARSFLEDVRA